MGADDDKQRSSSAREQRQLRGTLGDEPSGSYAYHDEVRVEHVRASHSSKPANDTGPAASGRVSKPTTMGGHQAPLAPEKMAQLVSPVMRAIAPSVPRRPHLSEPPEIGSWPPLPNVPDELQEASPMSASLDSKSRFRHDDIQDVYDAPTDPPKRPLASNAPSGAIWSATPSVLELAREDEGRGRYSDEPEAPEPIEPEPVSVPKPEPAIARAPAPAVKVADSELAKLEQLVARGAWEELIKLGNDPARPALYRLMHVIALRETLPTDAKGAGRLTQDGIAALAEVLGVSSSSPTALMLAKRLLRRNPVWTQAAPATGVSAGIVIVGLLVGGGLGWLLTRFVL